MSSHIPPTALWLERSRLDGMMLGAVSYGGFFILTVQAAIALMQRPRHGGKITDNRLALLAYIFITFVLGTIGLAGNVKYTEMVWIDLRDVPGGPVALIENEMAYPINVVTISCYFVMEWFTQALLLYRCCVIWNWARYVIIPVTTIYIAMIIMSVLVLIQSTAGAIWYNMNVQLAYFCIEVGLSVIYTVLVTNRLLVMRGLMRQVVQEHDYSNIYNTTILLVFESNMLYSACAIIFIVSFALHSNVSNLCFFSIGYVQGIAQLLIIISVARGQAITCELSTPVDNVSTCIVFSGTASDALEGSNNERVARSEQDSIRLYSVGTEFDYSVYETAGTLCDHAV
ncbi:uncharacterized protein EDB93DRAFT_1251436 [Suillus bovinus]|uniref:uncharacterized protein n=1 Tax=Suillus bovinus TaxID=48563 RepID=UPI001B8808F3|nr:uncharacterized protein EDB93DRAFT_1251436 [Suillus bovinus]KAG2145335.1 hypothetical protein EDB93DRAFT_1251436 [Suillus bovinus]